MLIELHHITPNAYSKKDKDDEHAFILNRAQELYLKAPDAYKEDQQKQKELFKEVAKEMSSYVLTFEELSPQVHHTEDGVKIRTLRVLFTHKDSMKEPVNLIKTP